MKRGLVIGLGVLGLVGAGGGVGAYLYLGRPGAAAPVGPAAPTPGTGGDTASAGQATGASKEPGAAAPASAKDVAIGDKDAAAGKAGAPEDRKTATVASAATTGDRPPGAGSPERGARAAPGQAVAEETPIVRLVRLYEGMRPKEAADVLSRLEPELSTAILMKMRERQAGKVLGMMAPDKAAQLTSRMSKARGE